MFTLANLVLWILGLLVLGALFLAFRHHFSASARTARRRARSHGPVINRKRGPSVKLAVNLKEPKRKE
jgi:hypothetical protein